MLHYYHCKKRIYFISFYHANNNLIIWDKLTERFMTNQPSSQIAYAT